MIGTARLPHSAQWPAFSTRRRAGVTRIGPPELGNLHEEAAREKTIRRLRPQTSETAPAPIIATASTAVVVDSDRLASAGETANSRANTGISGCTL